MPRSFCKVWSTSDTDPEVQCTTLVHLLHCVGNLSCGNPLILGPSQETLVMLEGLVLLHIIHAILRSVDSVEHRKFWCL